MEAIEIVRTQPQRQQRDIIEIQVGQDLQKQRNGKYIGVERHPLEKNHPERIPKFLSHTPFGQWLVAPKKANHKGKWPRDRTIIRVEKYKDTKESVEVKEAVAYGRDTSKMFCWYNFEEWKKCFKG